MRFPVKNLTRLGPVALGFALASCIPGATAVESAPMASDAMIDRGVQTGPQADYPVVVGEPFTIDGITHTPVDVLNYDEVGYATFDEPGASGISAAHRTLPLPSYVEVTSLESGQTILVRVERRGPMTNARLIALSPDARAQLGVGEGTPVRVRRVNPPEEDRAELRADRTAGLRMETPPGLLEVLKRKLPAVGSASLTRAEGEEAAALANAAPSAIRSVDPNTGAPSTRVPLEDEVTSGTVRATGGAPAAAPAPVATPDPAPKPSGDGNYVVQAGAYSSKAAAERVASSIDGYLEPVGRLWRVRTGPFTTRGQASTALAKVRGAGYSGAQIVTLR
ncbi:septal ring lytic transglycosylase RlpA family protein [Qipengyuania sp. SM2507]